MFNDRIVVESPGTLPGIVKINNMRQVHFSRNSKIAEFLHEYEYVQEFGEGVDRMFEEMQKAGLPAPEYKSISFMLNATIRNTELTDDSVNDSVNLYGTNLNKREKEVLKTIESNPCISILEISKALSVSESTINRSIRTLKQKQYIRREGSDKNGKWIILK